MNCFTASTNPTIVAASKPTIYNCKSASAVTSCRSLRTNQNLVAMQRLDIRHVIRQHRVGDACLYHLPNSFNHRRAFQPNLAPEQLVRLHVWCVRTTSELGQQLYTGTQSLHAHTLGNNIVNKQRHATAHSIFISEISETKQGRCRHADHPAFGRILAPSSRIPAIHSAILCCTTAFYIHWPICPQNSQIGQ